MYKVFYNDASIFIGEGPQDEAKSPMLQLTNKDTLYRILDQYFMEEEPGELQLTGSDPASIWLDFRSYFHCIEAAGGWVKNSQGQSLFIKRLGRWDLPKGKMEAGESPEKCALREVEEECGVKGLRIIKRLPSSYHIYPWKKRWVLKRTYWYLMSTSYTGPLVPQIKEDITEVHWLKPAACRQALQSSYRSLADSLKSCLG